jgi:hypothetical protein
MSSNFKTRKNIDHLSPDELKHLCDALRFIIKYTNKKITIL